MKAKQLKMLLASLLGAFVLCLLVLFICDRVVVSFGSSRIFDDIDDVPENEYGVLLGTTPKNRIGRINRFFTYRIDAATQLYNARKVKCILISGDANSLHGMNEVVAMRDSLIARGIPKENLILDGRGFRTLDSLVRACKVYDIHSFISISQRFHNERAIYLAQHLGLDLKDVMGYNAKDPESVFNIMPYVREYFARVKVFVDILTDKQPASLER